MKVKLCGMFREEDIRAVNEVRPDYCGFVVNFPKSHRSVSPQRLRALRKALAEGITPVGVFVDESPALVEALLKEGVIEAAQLHGGEDEAYIKRIKANTGKPVIKAFAVRRKEDLSAAEESAADFVLLDYGKGDGQTFDWELLREAKESGGLSRPFFLAGGLSAENIRGAMEMLSPFAVDLSSGIETEKEKDPEKMREILRLIRG